MNDFKDNISQEVLDSLTMEDLWKCTNPGGYRTIAGAHWKQCPYCRKERPKEAKEDKPKPMVTCGKETTEITEEDLEEEEEQ